MSDSNRFRCNIRNPYHGRLFDEAIAPVYDFNIDVQSDRTFITAKYLIRGEGYAEGLGMPADTIDMDAAILHLARQINKRVRDFLHADWNSPLLSFSDGEGA